MFWGGGMGFLNDVKGVQWLQLLLWGQGIEF
jgi:hypothetical protein